MKKLVPIKKLGEGLVDSVVMEALVNYVTSWYPAQYTWAEQKGSEWGVFVWTTYNQLYSNESVSIIYNWYSVYLRETWLYE
jgi:hypothetical protein